jgi:hypothetical protein
MINKQLNHTIAQLERLQAMRKTESLFRDWPEGRARGRASFAKQSQEVLCFQQPALLDIEKTRHKTNDKEASYAEGLNLSNTSKQSLLRIDYDLPCSSGSGEMKTGCGTVCEDALEQYTLAARDGIQRHRRYQTIGRIFLCDRPRDSCRPGFVDIFQGL